jgi:hypothetical protein
VSRPELKGEHVDKPNRIAQIYGYTVCLVALIVALISLTAILNAMFERANPLQSNRFGFASAALTSFDAYKATRSREAMQSDPNQAARRDTVPDTVLRQRYDALVADRIVSTRYQTGKTLTTSGILLLVAIGLFAFHWRWVRRLNGAATSGGG